LVTVFLVLPFRLVSLNITFGAFIKLNRLGSSELGFGAFSVSLMHRVNAVQAQIPVF
jgi:hypothetical protein